MVNFLIATGWLDAALADDRAEVGKAIGAMVADAEARACPERPVRSAQALRTRPNKSVRHQSND